MFASVLIDLRLSELARSLGMPGPEGQVQDNKHGGKNELKPHFRSLLECCAVSVETIIATQSSDLDQTVLMAAALLLNAPRSRHGDIATTSC